MKKIILIPILLLVLGSCSFFGNKNNGGFTDLYQANIRSSVASLDELSVLLGVNRHESIDGSIRSAVSVPGILSGTLSSDYSGLIDGGNSESFFRNVRLLFTSLVNSGSISADEIGVVSHGADSWLSYKNLVDADMMSDDIKKVLKKYENNWLSLIEKSSSGMTTKELMEYTIARNLTTKSLSDIEKYLTDYPIFHDTVDLGMSGSLHFWSVELDRAHILALSKQLTADLAGTGMTDADAIALAKNLESLSFSGKMGLDPTNAKVSSLDGVFSASGKVISSIFLIKNENNGSIRISSPKSDSEMILNYGKKENRYSFDGALSQSGTEMGKINGYIEHTGAKFQELSLEASAQGMTVTLKHSVDGNKFTGKLSAVLGTIEWSGTTGDETLKSLKITGTSPVGSLTANLTESGSMVVGPVVVKSGEETIFNANLALQIAKQKFAIILDVLSEAFPAHFDLDISGKSTPSTKRVVAPTSSKSFQDLMTEISELTPADPSFSDLPSESSLSDTGSVGLPQ